MTTRVSVFMPSYNKGNGWVQGGIHSLLQQTDDRWELHVLDNSTDDMTRERLRKIARNDQRILLYESDLGSELRAVKDPPVYLCNQFYPEANGDIIVYMSDDDMLSPGLVSTIIKHFDKYPAEDAIYWNALVAHCQRPTDTIIPRPWINATIDRGPGQLDCQVDGGQIAVRKRAFERLEKPWYPEDLALGMNSHSDGVLMEKLAASGVVFHPVNFNGLIHRRTPVSVYTKA